MPDDTQELTLRIYDAVADPDRWPRALDQLVDRVGALGSVVFEWADVGEGRELTAPIHSGSYPPHMVETYLTKCGHLEACDQDAIRRLTSNHDDIELLDDAQLAASREDEGGQEHLDRLQRLGIGQRTAGVMNKDNRWISLFCMQFDIARPPLGDAERHYLSQLLPHLAKALDLSIPMRQLQSRYRGVLSAIDRLTVGICVLDARGLIVARNEEFRRQQETYRTFRVDHGGRLRIADPEGQRCFETLTTDLNRHGRFGARPRKECVLSHTLDDLCIEIAPLHRSDELSDRRFDGFLLCSTDTSLPISCDSRRVQQAFDLTATETSLVDAIAQGLTNPEIADRRGRRVATINAQIKSILAKSNCATRTQFVRMAMRFGGRFVA